MCKVPGDCDSTASWVAENVRKALSCTPGGHRSEAVALQARAWWCLAGTHVTPVSALLSCVASVLCLCFLYGPQGLDLGPTPL